MPSAHTSEWATVSTRSGKLAVQVPGQAAFHIRHLLRPGLTSLLQLPTHLPLPCSGAVPAGCQGSGKELIQPVLDNQLKAASPLVLPQQVRAGCW